MLKWVIPKNMRILLQNTETGKFYAGAETWTADDGEALAFDRTDAAMDTVYDLNLEHTRLLMRFEQPFLEISMSIAGFGR